MNRDVKFDEILQKAKDIYFPNGKSQKGSIEDMSLEMSDFTLKPLKRFTNLNEQECTYKTHLSCRGLFPSRSAVILMTRKNKTVNGTENTEPISQQSLQTSADDRLSSCTNDMGESIETSIPCNTMPRITVKYSKVKQSIYCSDTVSISITGRDQVKAFIQREHGEEVPDPLDYDFTVQHIKKDGKVYLDTALTQDMLKDTVLGLEPMEMKGPEENKLNFVFPSATADSTSTIIHGPNEIFGVDGEELVIGVVCRNYGKELIYRWFKDDQMIKYGTNPSLIKVSQNGTYFCEVKDETTGKTQKSEKIVFQEVKLSAKDEVQDTPPLIPIIALSDLQFSKTDELGKGAFARVYKGSWIGSSVAIKVVDLKKRSKTKIQGMVEEEIKIHSKIRHPNIVQLMAVAYDVRSIFLVSEFIDGFNMEDMIFDENVKNRLTVTIQNKLYISMQCLQAISYLHGMENPIIHRDVKPANILIDHKSLTTKLCDLGVSRVKSYTSYSLTNIGGQPGTPAYMAPEVILQGKSATKKSDIWSIGTSLVELFVEEEAWGDLDTPEDIKEVMQKRKPPVALEKVTEPVKNILANCLKYVPEDRPDALEVLLAIRKHV